MECIGTVKNGWQRWHSSNDASTSFTAPAATTTKPTTNVFERPGQITENLISCMFIGTGADNATFDCRIIGWSKVSDGTQWLPTLLAAFTCTLSGAVGAGGDVLATERFADTIAGASLNPSGGVEVVSPTGDIAGHVVVDTKGAQLVQVVYDMTGATGANTLVKWL